MRTAIPSTNCRHHAGLRGTVIAALMLAVVGPSPHVAAQSPPVTTSSSGVNCDPCVPEAVRKQAELEKARMADIPARTLAASTADRLRARFEAADLRKSGRLTRAEALTGGFGFIAQNFEAIDRQGRGEISFDDLKAYLVARGARLE